jgi:hypothetical protein
MELRDSDMNMRDSDMGMRDSDMKMRDSDMELRDSDMNMTDSDTEMRDSDIEMRDSDMNMTKGVEPNIHVAHSHTLTHTHKLLFRTTNNETQIWTQVQKKIEPNTCV